MPSVPPFEDVTDLHVMIPGWVGTSRDRGSIDILYSSCLTILLCFWVSTQPNASGPKDRWYHRFIDKFNLAMVGLLGPDFLFGIAIGQLSSARRSVKVSWFPNFVTEICSHDSHQTSYHFNSFITAFRADKQLSQGLKWTYRHAFFVNMGGIFLASPDFPDGFPINAQEFHYLIKHNYVDFS